jgi:hypothetical protein
MPPLQLALSLLLLAAPEGGSPAAAAAGANGARALPWKVDRNYKYIWSRNQQKLGETTLRFQAVEVGPKPSWKLISQRRLELDGKVQTTRGELVFRADGAPLHYQENTAFSSPPFFGAVQDLEVQFRGREVTTTFVNNGKQETAARHKLEVPAGTLFYTAHALEHWTVLALALGAEETRTLDIFYPDQNNVLRVTLRRAAKPETIELGGLEVEARRHDFSYETYPETGSIWLDAGGRLLKYRSGSLTLQLEAEKPGSRGEGRKEGE